MTTDNGGLPIYDIYVLSEGGVPVFAGCTTSDYCAKHEGQHPLHAGFIHAIQNFGDEVFSSNIRDLKFNTVKLNFKSIGSYSIVFVNPPGTSDKFIQEKLDAVAQLFENKYMDQLQVHHLSDEMYYEFMEDIVDIGLIAKDRIKSTREIFVTEQRPEPQTTTTTASSSIFSKFKQRFMALIS